jgi:hypothetical protein
LQSQVTGHNELLLQASNNSKNQGLSLIFQDAVEEFAACWESAQSIGPVSPITSCAISIETARNILNSQDFYIYCCTMNKLTKMYSSLLPWYIWTRALLYSMIRKSKKSIVNDIDDYLASVIGELDDR